MKLKNIPTKDLGMVAYYLLQITQGVFKWNGELFFCPFVALDDKLFPFRIKTWIKEGLTNEKKKYSLPFIQNNTLLLFADPVDPETYSKTKQHVMDRSLGIDATTIVLKKNNKLIIKNNEDVHILEFVKKISDQERRVIFDPNDSWENKFRYYIWKASKLGGRHMGKHTDEWIKEYRTYRRKIA